MATKFARPLILVLVIGCSAEQPTRLPPQPTPVVEDSKLDEPLPAPEVRAPWETTPTEDEQLKKLLSEKNAREALLLLEEKKKSAPTLEVYRDKASLLLKLGRPNEALTTVSEFVSLNKLGMEDVPGELSLIAAYAYKKQKDIDQTFAWFGVTLRKNSPAEAAVAKQEVQNLLARISDKIFADYFIKWERDQSLAPLILDEQNRRRDGGTIVRLEETDYFSPDTYGYSTKEIPKVIPLAAGEKPAEIAVIIPVKASRIAEDQRKAIELALSAAIPPLAHQIITSSDDQLPALPKVIINLGIKYLLPATISKGAVVISLNPRLAVTDTSIAAKLSEEVQELIKISESSQCEQTFAVVEDAYSLPSTIKRTTVDELLSTASTQPPIAAPCLIGGFEVEDQVENLTRIKARWPGLRLFGRSSWVDPVLLQTYQGLFEGSVFITPFYSGSSRELVREFLSSFQNSSGNEGSYNAALAYDAGRISALILGNKETESASYNLQSVTGIETFVVNIDKASGTKRVSVSQRRFTRLTLKNGDLEELGSF